MERIIILVALTIIASIIFGIIGSYIEDKKRKEKSVENLENFKDICDGQALMGWQLLYDTFGNHNINRIPEQYRDRINKKESMIVIINGEKKEV